MMTWKVVWKTEADEGVQECTTWDEAWAAFAGLAADAENDALSCEVFTLWKGELVGGTEEDARVLSFRN